MKKEVGKQPEKKRAKPNFKEFLFVTLYFGFYLELRFITFGLVMKKLWTIFFFGQFHHLLKEIADRIHFYMQFSQIL